MPRGGIRPGAGRKRLATPPVNITLSVQRDVAELAGKLRSKGVKVNKLFADAVREKYDSMQSDK